MNKLFKFISYAAAVVAAALMYGCSGGDKASVTGLIDNEHMACMVNFKSLSASAGERLMSDMKNSDGLSGALAAPALMMSVDGIDVERVLLLPDNSMRRFAWVASVTDRAKAEKSIAALPQGFKPEKGDGLTLYKSASERSVLALDDSYLWVLNAGGDAKDRIADIRENAEKNPVAAWKLKILESPATVNFAGPGPNGKVQLGTVEFKGSEMKSVIDCYDTDGRRASFIPDSLGFEKIGSDVASYVDRDATVSVVIGRVDIKAWWEVARNILPLSTSDVLAVAAVTEGPAMGYVNLDPRSPMSPETMTGAVRARATDKLTARMAVSAMGARLSADIPMVRRSSDGRYGLYLEGDKPMAELYTDGDWIVAATPGVSAGTKLVADDYADCLLVLRFNLSPEIVDMLSGVKNLGLKGFVKLKSESAEVTVQVTGTDKPFIEAIADVIPRL